MFEVSSSVVVTPKSHEYDVIKGLFDKLENVLVNPSQLEYSGFNTAAANVQSAIFICKSLRCTAIGTPFLISVTHTVTQYTPSPGAVPVIKPVTGSILIFDPSGELAKNSPPL